MWDRPKYLFADMHIVRQKTMITRGRDGFIVFVPPGADNVTSVLNKAGIKELK